MMQSSTRDRDGFHRDIARRMAQPKKLRDLQNQVECMKREQARQTQASLDALWADDLRRKIRDMGGTPCA